MSEPFDPNEGPPLLGNSPIHQPEGQPETPPPVKKPVWKSWLAAGIVAAAFAGGAVLAVTLTGHHGSGNNDAVQITSSTDNGGNASGGDPNGGQNGGQSGTNGGGQFARRFAGRGAAGTITAIDGKTLTLETRDFAGDSGTTKVVTTDGTKFTEMAEGKVSDIKVGDNVLVTTDDDTGAANITATNIVDNGDQQVGFFRRRDNGGTPPSDQTPPAPPSDQAGPGDGAQRFGNFGNGRLRVGEVANVDGSTITIKTVQGDTVTVATNSDTKVAVTKTISLKDLRVGDAVRAEGSTNDGTVTADSVQRGDLGGVRGLFPGGPGHGGQSGPPPSSSTD